MSLKGRFVSASSAIAFVTLSGACAAVYLAYNAGQERQLDGVLLAEAQEDARAEASVDAGSVGARLPLRHGEITKYAVVYDASGQPIRWTSNLDSARPRLDLIHHAAGAPFDVWWNNEHFRAVHMPVPGQSGHSLLLATPRSDVDGDARDLARKMAMAVIVAVLASAAASLSLARRLTREHDRIVSVARAVAAGDLSARIGTTSDDPEMARLSRDVDEMISRLAVLVETQQQFIANASHELRSPITTFLGELSFALRRERDAASYRASIEEALNSARRLKALTEDLLALTRIGARDVERDSVSLAEVTRVALRSLREEADAALVTLEASCDGAKVEGHAADLERLVRNLVENAIRHSPRGGRVRVEAHPGSGEVRLVVSDDGPGVPASVRERIFEPFFRLAADRAEHPGAGLGLAIVRTIARAHGGDVSVEDSASSRGARFVVRLPLCGPGAGG